MERKRPTRHNTDRISGLPLAIIHDHILPSLPDKDVKVMSSLSKTWYHITSSFPYFDFDESCFGPPTRENTDKFLNYVTRTLQRFHDQNHELKLQIQKLTLRLPTFRPRMAPIVDSWIELVSQHGVEELNLIMKPPGNDHIYRPTYALPRSVFAAKSIKAAFINGCSLLRAFPKKYICGSSCNLRRLVLMKVVLDELTLRSIISSCPLLEELSFMLCLGDMNCLRISNLPKLKDLQISKWLGEEDNPVVEIDVPSLQHLLIKGCTPKSTRLDLDYNLHLEDILSRLPSLRSLHLWGLSRLTKLKLSSHTLNKLKIYDCKKLVKLEIDAPNLVSTSYSGDFAPLASSKYNEMCPWEYVNTGYNGLMNPLIKVEDFLVELSKFFSKAKHVGYLYLYFHDINHRFSLKELHQRVVQPAASIDHLELSFLYTYIKKLSDLLDGVLWSCHPRILSIEFDHSAPEEDKNKDLVKKMCKMIIRHRGFCSCTRARSSWLHRLEDVMYVKKDGSEGRLPLDGTSAPYFPRLCSKIKFIFKW